MKRKISSLDVVIKYLKLMSLLCGILMTLSVALFFIMSAKIDSCLSPVKLKMAIAECRIEDYSKDFDFLNGKVILLENKLDLMALRLEAVCTTLKVPETHE